MNKIQGSKRIFLLITAVCLLIIIFTKLSVELSPNGCVKQLPGVLIIGAPKCGTAALSLFLSNHPDIAINAKTELEFFSINYALGFDWYKL